MVAVMRQLGVEATTGHWEFTLGADRVQRAVRRRRSGGIGGRAVPGRQRARHRLRATPVFEGTRMFEKGGVKVAVIGQAFPYTPIANPRWMMPNWTFGIREDDVRRSRGPCARVRRRGRRAAVAQRLRRRPQDGAAGRGHRRHPHRAHPRCAARARQGRPHAADRLGLARQVPVAARPGGRQRPRHRFHLQADPDPVRRHRARSGHGAADHRDPRAARGDAGHRAGAQRRPAVPARHLRRHAR